jgi:type III pantothenate kinase
VSHVLEVDAGNTRLKWRLRSTGLGGERIDGGAVAPERPEDLLAAVAGRDVGRVLVASVRGGAFEDAFRRACVERLGLDPGFVRSAGRWGALRSAYAEPERMGVDRWLAMIAGRTLEAGPFVCADAGSALTVDVVAGDGEHLGGWILPGRELMRRSLFAGTDAVKVPSADAAAPEPGRDTAACVGNGLLAVPVALIRSARELLGAGPAVPVLLSGGDAPAIAPHVPGPVRHVAELVLDGLSVVGEGAS